MNPSDMEGDGRSSSTRASTRSAALCIQYQESDLQFVQRLLREEGLFHWFEHTGDAGSAALGAHTLVIADHNGAFKANAQPRIRYTQSGVVQSKVTHEIPTDGGRPILARHFSRRDDEHESIRWCGSEAARR